MRARSRFSKFMFVLGISIWPAVLQLVVAQDFEFVTSNPTQCDSMTITWQGGKPPIVATISPPGGSQRNTTLESNGSNPHSFGVFVPFPKDKTFLVTLSDATSFASGGTSQLLTVGNPVSGNNCNTTDPGVDFFFNLDSRLVQCQPFPITGYVGAVQPVTISILIPGGQSTVITPPISTTNSFNWTANVKAGTSLVFSITDANGRKGGTESIRVVEDSDDSSCLNNPISSTPAATIKPTNTASQSQRPSPKKSKRGLSAAAIAAIAVAAGILIGIILLTIWWIKRKRKSDVFARPVASDIDLDQDTYSIHLPPGQYTPDPFIVPHTPSAVSSQQNLTASGHPSVHAPPMGQHSRVTSVGQTSYSSADVSSNTHGGTSDTSLLPSQPRATSKSAFASSAPRESRVVVHEDIGDVVELPPQYSEGRTPLPENLSAYVRLPTGP